MPKYSELSVAKILEYIQEYPDLLEYFSDLEPGQLSERKFLFKIIETLRLDEMKQLVFEERVHRSIANISTSEALIEMIPSVRDELF